MFNNFFKIIFIIIITLLIAALLVFWVHFHKKDESFRCTGTVLMTAEQMNGNVVQINAALNLRTGRNNASMLINGKLLENGKAKTIQRQILLKEPSFDGDNGTNFSIDRINKGKLDAISDDAFDFFLTEFSGSVNNIYMYSTHIRDDVFLIGGPLSYIFTCKRYKS